MRHDGKPVHRLVGVYFRREDGWDTPQAEAVARRLCAARGGEFIPMTNRFVVEATANDQDTSGPVWHRLIPSGPLPGLDITLTEEHFQGMIDAFHEGIPTTGGVPIDEDGLHNARAEGAFGWIVDLELRDGDLWGAIEWTDEGRQAIRSGRYRFLSPHFFLDGGSSTPYGRDNVLLACALCTRPLLFDQSPLVAAVQLATAQAAEDASREEKRAAQKRRAEKWGIEAREDGNLTPPAAYNADCPNEDDYGDPVNFAYPLKPVSRLRNAAARFAQNYQEYKQVKSRRVIWTRIVSAMKAAGVNHTYTPGLDDLLPQDLKEWAKEPRRRKASLGGASVDEAKLSQLRALYTVSLGRLPSEEEWNEFLATVETDEALDDLIASLNAQLGEASKPAPEPPAPEADLEREIEELRTRIAELEAERNLAEAKASLLSATLPDGSKYAPSAVEVLASAQVNPCPETVTALVEHLSKHGGRLAAVPPAETVAVAASSAEPASDEEWLKNKPMTDKTRAEVVRVMKAENIGAEDAYDVVLKRRYGR